MTPSAAGDARRGRSTEAQTTPRTRILIVCTANQCRSPLAAAIARREAVGLPIDFDSVGLIAGGRRMPNVGVRVARELGLDLTEHVSQQLDAATTFEFDVVLTMTREQSREIVAAQPDLWPRVFTLKQFSRWIHDHPCPPGESLRSWLRIEAASRSRADLIGSSAEDDVFDPLRSSARVWRSVALELQTHLTSLLGSIYPTE